MTDKIIIDGKLLANQFKQDLIKDIHSLPLTLKLSVVLVGDNPASHLYVNRKKEACEEVGISLDIHTLPTNVTQSHLIELIDQLNGDKSVTGILIQLPLPSHINSLDILTSVHPLKDVDGLTPMNLGLLFVNQPQLIPCTPLGCMHLIHTQKNDITGLECLVIGRSNLVGKPMACLLSQAGATVTLAHSKTRDLPLLTKRADIIVAAAGSAQLVKGDWIKAGAIVIDVGINRLPSGKLSGDVAFEEVNNASITPVPGGVGPMTIAMLLNNVLKAYKLQSHIV